MRLFRPGSPCESPLARPRTDYSFDPDRLQGTDSHGCIGLRNHVCRRNRKQKFPPLPADRRYRNPRSENRMHNSGRRIRFRSPTILRTSRNVAKKTLGADRAGRREPIIPVPHEMSNATEHYCSERWFSSTSIAHSAPRIEHPDRPDSHRLRDIGRSESDGLPADNRIRRKTIARNPAKISPSRSRKRPALNDTEDARPTKAVGRLFVLVSVSERNYQYPRIRIIER